VKKSPNVTDEDYIARWKARCVITASGCWEWQGHCCKFRNQKPGQRGYAEGWYRGKNVRLHRKVLEIRLGRLLEPGELALHRCDNPPCLCPDHVWAGSQKLNKLDEVAKGRNYCLPKTHCPRGHRYTPENTYKAPGRDGRGARNCKTCMRIRQRLRAGWTEEQAMRLPRTPNGYRPVGGVYKPAGPTK